MKPENHMDNKDDIKSVFQWRITQDFKIMYVYTSIGLLEIKTSMRFLLESVGDQIIQEFLVCIIINIRLTSIKHSNLALIPNYLLT